MVAPDLHRNGCRRVETNGEEIEQRAGDRGIGRQRRLLEARPRIQARLHAVATERPYQSGLAPMDPKFQHEAVETVTLGPAVPDRGEGPLKWFLNVAELDVAAVFVLDEEFMDPDATRVSSRGGRFHRITFFDQGGEAHVLQDRRDAGQPRRRFTVAVELESKLKDRVLRAPKSPHADVVVGPERFDHADIGQRFRGVVSVAIARRESLGKGCQDGRGSGCVRDASANRRVKVVGPGPRGPRYLVFDVREVGVQVVARRHADDELHPGKGRVREARIVGRNATAIGFREQLAGANSQPGVVAISRHVEQDRSKPIERVDPDEQLHPWSVEQVENVQRDSEKVVFADLEELIPRKGLENIREPSRVVASFQKAGPHENATDLFPEEGNVLRGLVVGLHGKEPDESHLADWFPARAKAPDADVVHVDPPMDPRPKVRLGDNDRVAGLQFPPQGRRQNGGFVSAAEHEASGITKNA